jgi:hypothetical protein
VPEKLPVLYVAGTGRTGSTLIARALASSPGAVAPGEIRHIWTRGLVEDWQCGCGRPFRGCPFWDEVLTEASFDRDRANVDRLRASERELLRLRASVKSLLWSRHPQRMRQRHGYYLDMVDRLYRAIAKVANADVIVDSSKNPLYGGLLSTLSAIDLRVLHLIRDPRATSYSWLNPKPSPDRGDGAAMDRLGIAKSAFLWSWWNALAEALWPRGGSVPVLRVRYETLTANFEPSLRVIRDLLLPEHAGRPLEVVGDKVRLRPVHSVSGNPDRMTSGMLTVRPDDRWRVGLAGRRRAAVVAIAGFQMVRYGYPWTGE